MTSINRRYFESLMADRKMSLRKLASLMGMNHSQLSLMFSGARRAQLDEAAQISQIFNEPFHKVVEALGVTVRPNAGKRVDVVGAVRGDGTVEMNAGVVERTTAPEGLPEDVIAIQNRTAGSPRDWADGFVHFCRRPNGIESDALGRFCYVKIKNGPATIAMMRRGYEDGTFNLLGTFDATNVEIEFATPILITRY